MTLGMMATVTPVERRQSERFDSGRLAAMRLVDGTPATATIESISTEGVCVQTELTLEVGALVRIGLPRGSPLQATVQLIADGKAGCKFRVPLAVHDLVQALDPI